MSSLDMYMKRGDIFTHDCLEMLMLTIIYGWTSGVVLSPSLWYLCIVGQCVWYGQWRWSSKALWRWTYCAGSFVVLTYMCLQEPCLEPSSFCFGFLGSGVLCMYFLRAVLFLGLWCMCTTMKIGLFLRVIQSVDCLAMLRYILEWQKKLVNIQYQDWIYPIVI